MTPKEIIEALRLTFNELVNNEATPVALSTYKLVDGTEVEITELAVGGIVTIAGTPAPIGDHQLEDGTVITVGDNGAITAIVPAQPMPEEALPMVEDMTARFAAFETATNEKFASYEVKFSEYEAKLKKANKVIEGLLNLTQTLAEAPTGTPDPIVKTTNNFKEEKTEKNYSVLFN